MWIKFPFYPKEEKRGEKISKNENYVVIFPYSENKNKNRPIPI